MICQTQFENLWILSHEEEGAVMYLFQCFVRVVKHFGYQYVNALRTALCRFPNELVVQATFYIKRKMNYF